MAFLTYQLVIYTLLTERNERTKRHSTSGQTLFAAKSRGPHFSGMADKAESLGRDIAAGSEMKAPKQFPGGGPAWFMEPGESFWDVDPSEQVKCCASALGSGARLEATFCWPEPPDPEGLPVSISHPLGKAARSAPLSTSKQLLRPP